MSAKKVFYTVEGSHVRFGAGDGEGRRWSYETRLSEADALSPADLAAHLTITGALPIGQAQALQVAKAFAKPRPGKGEE